MLHLKVRIDINCEWTDEQTENQTALSHLAKAGATKNYSLDTHINWKTLEKTTNGTVL